MPYGSRRGLLGLLAGLPLAIAAAPARHAAAGILRLDLVAGEDWKQLWEEEARLPRALSLLEPGEKLSSCLSCPCWAGGDAAAGLNSPAPAGWDTLENVR